MWCNQTTLFLSARKRPLRFDWKSAFLVNQVEVVFLLFKVLLSRLKLSSCLVYFYIIHLSVNASNNWNANQRLYSSRPGEVFMPFIKFGIILRVVRQKTQWAYCSNNYKHWGQQRSTPALVILKVPGKVWGRRIFGVVFLITHITHLRLNNVCFIYVFLSNSILVQNTNNHSFTWKRRWFKANDGILKHLLKYLHLRCYHFTEINK